jgi:hypothetical protein
MSFMVPRLIIVAWTLLLRLKLRASQVPAHPAREFALNYAYAR